MSRITHMMSTRSILHDVQSSSERVEATRRKLASGKQIERPSDDPLGTNRALTLRGDLEGTRQYQRNVKDALGWQETTDVALAQIGDVVHRARELLIQAGSDSTSGESRKAIAVEIDQLIEAAKQEANTTFAGRYVFSGTATTTRPYATGSPVDAYAGNSATLAREIGPGVAVQVNSIASDVLGDGQLAADNRLLHVLRDISNHLTANDGNSLRSTDLVRLDANMDEIVRQRAVVGATSNRLETAGSRLLELEESAQGLLSETEDADMAKAMVDFSMQQSVYQAALKSGANIVQASLLDFLR